MKRIENITVDIKNKEYDEITLKQLDTTQLIFKVLENSKPLNLSEKYKASIIFTKPNGRIVIQDAKINVSNKTIEVVLLESCLAVYGRGKIEVEIKEGSERISSFQLLLKIEKTAEGEQDLGHIDFIEDVKREMQEMKEKWEQASTGYQELEDTVGTFQAEQQTQNENIKKNTDNIELLKEENDKLKQENKALRQDINNITSTAEGEGESITLKNTVDAKFKELKISGNSWQETREGYNRLNVASGADSTVVKTNDFSVTNNKDGTITINGVLSQANRYYLTDKPITYTKDKARFMFEVISGSANILSEGVFLFGFFGGDNSEVSSVSVKSDFSEKFSETFDITTKETTVSPYLHFGWTEGQGGFAEFNNYRIRLQVTEGEEEKPYEPYGAKPSPEFSSKIRNCGDNVNLLPMLNNATKEQGEGVNVTANNNGTYNIVGTATGQTTCSYVQFFSFDVLNIKNGQTYTLSASEELPEGVDFRVEVYNGGSWVRNIFNSTLTGKNKLTKVADLSRTELKLD